jgi:hypothetical protein
VDDQNFIDWLNKNVSAERAVRLSDEEALMGMLLKGKGAGINLLHTQHNPAQEVRQLKFEELEVVMPLIGTRVMINPAHYDRVSTKYHGLSGFIVNEGGEYRTVKQVINHYKENRNIPHWSVRVMYDNGESHSIRIEHLLPISNGHRDMRGVTFVDGESYIWTEEQYRANINRHIIGNQNTVLKEIIYNNEYRQKKIDEA